MKLVSAIVTTCKREPTTVVRAVDSILAQTYPNIEIIVVDDSPSDYPLRSEVQEKICNKSLALHYLTNVAQSGACYSRNRGLAVAKGEYIAFLDDDDEWLPEKIAKQVQKLEASGKKTAMVYCDYFKLDDMTQKQQEINLIKRKGRIFDDLMCLGNFCGGMSIPMMRTQCLKDINGFDENMTSGQDYDVWLRLAEKYLVDYIAEPLAVYHWHQGEQITKNPMLRISGTKRLIKKNRRYYRTHCQAYGHILLTSALEYATAGQLWQSVKNWFCAFFLCPFRLKKNMRGLYGIVRQFSKQNIH